jgi:hypothetical protein
MNHCGVAYNRSSERKGLLGKRIGFPDIHSAMNKFASFVAATAMISAGLGWARGTWARRAWRT